LEAETVTEDLLRRKEHIRFEDVNGLRNLLDEALDLWHAIIQATPSPASPEIISLLPSLFPIFE
jgi:pyridoxine 5'-phosphate synthase PdxJ